MTRNWHREFFEKAPTTTIVPPPVVVEESFVDNSIDNWWDFKKTVYIDTETTDGNGKGSLNALDPNSNIAIVQTSINGKIEIRRWSDETAAWLQDLDSQGYTFVFHNAPFDLFFLKVKGNVTLSRIYDTQIASQVINAGKEKVDQATAMSRRTEAVNKDEVLDIADNLFDDMEDDEDDIGTKTKKASFFSHSLGATAWRYAKVKMVKDLGNSDWSRDPLTPDQIRYAEEDVKHLERIVKNQLFIAKKFGITKVLKLEMELIPAVVDMRVQGILIDKENWLKEIEKYESEYKELEVELNNKMGLELAEREDLGDSLFGVLPKEFSVSSNTQLKEFFKDELVDGKPIESVGEEILKNIKHPLITSILRYKEVFKLATTYGVGYLKHIHPDGRIHAELKQVSNAQGKAIATGRFASSNPNLQNIPPKLLKKLVKSREGYTRLIADYSSVEAKILAYAANDPGYIDSVNSTDIHRVNAAKMFKVPVEQVTADMRSKAKVLSFAVPYGASAMGMWQKGLGETLEEAEKLLNDFYDSFPMVKKYLDKMVVDALTRGYTQDYYGRVRWYEIPDSKDATDDEIKKVQKRIRRQAQNHTIQSLSASVTKLAILLLHKLLLEKGWGYMILTIHDSIFFEIKDECLAEALPVIKEVMESTGPMIMPELKTPIDFDIGDIVARTDKISGLKFEIYEYVWSASNGLEKNPQVLSEDTEKALKFLGIPITDDYQDMFVQVLDKLETAPVEWLEKNKKWVAGVKSLVK